MLTACGEKERDSEKAVKQSPEQAILKTQLSTTFW